MWSFAKKPYQKLTHWCVEHSTIAFFSLLILLFGCIALSHFLRAPKSEEAKPVRETKQTALYSKDTPVYIEASTELKKEGVTNIVALTPGIVTRILVYPGQAVTSGSTLLALTNDYNSGSAGIGQAIAKNNLFLSQEIERLGKDIRTTEERVIKRSTELNAIQEAVALNNLKKERTNRQVSLANASLNYNLATVSDAVLYPKALQSGFVQSIAVRTGQYVNPGQVLATLSNPRGETILEAFIQSDTAPFVDMTKEAQIVLPGGETIKLLPTYFSSSEDELGMFSIRFVIPAEWANKIPAGKNPLVSLPLRFSHEQTFLVPLDAVFQNSTGATLLVVEDNKAVSRSVTLGTVRGNFVEVLDGMHQEDKVILNRFVLAGDEVLIVQ